MGTMDYGHWSRNVKGRLWRWFFSPTRFILTFYFSPHSLSYFIEMCSSLPFKLRDDQFGRREKREREEKRLQKRKISFLVNAYIKYNAHICTCTCIAISYIKLLLSVAVVMVGLGGGPGTGLLLIGCSCLPNISTGAITPWTGRAYFFISDIIFQKKIKFNNATCMEKV